MTSKRIVILGGGISGLMLAWELSKRVDCSITILEKSTHAGGYIQTDTRSEFLFEKGPRTFRSQSSDLLQLIEALNLKDQLIYSDPSAQKRYIWTDEQLVQVPSIYLLKKIVWPLLKEWTVAPHSGDETIYQFAARRFNQKVAELLFDPLTLGIFAGDIHTLSMQACFPKLKAWETRYGSLTRALLAQKRSGKTALFSFQKGSQTLIDALVAQMRASIHFGQEVRLLRFLEHEIEITTQDSVWKADYVFSALPADVCGRLLLPADSEIASQLFKIEQKGLSVVNVGYHADVLPLKGFGYLVPSSQGEKILGTVFDSKIFPQQNRSSKETRLTLMIRESARDPVETALEGLQRHLHIFAKPDYICATQLTRAIPQYSLGHLENISSLERTLKKRFPRFQLVGNYLRGASVSDCVTEVKSKLEGW
jgi:oxygen-dependent protoporphyrinogen oxidase